MNFKRTLFLVLSIVILVSSSISLVSGMTNSKVVSIKDNALKVVVYNTHAQEKFKFGDSLIDVSKELTQNLNNYGLKCQFLLQTDTDFTTSYISARKLIMENVQDNFKNVLLDIHTVNNAENSTSDITIHIGKGHKEYENNEDFAIKLLKQINKLDKNLSTEISENEYRYNQDLSNKAIIIILGNESMPKEKIYKILDVLASALKNISE